MLVNNDIYSRLLAGESMEDIMEDLTAQANEAQARYDEFKRLEEERLKLEEAERKMREAAEREAKNAAKREQLTDIITSTLYFCAEFYPSLGITTEEVDDMSDETIDALVELFLMLLDMEVAQKASKPLRTTMKLGPMTFPFRAPKATIAEDIERGLRSTSNTMDEATVQDVLKDAPVNKPTTDDIFASFFKTFM